MVAYSFQPGFLEPIRARTKKQTIRLPRKRHARPSEQLQFLTGPRMKPIRVGYAICREIHDVRLDFAQDQVTVDDAYTIADPQLLDAYAREDGFGGILATDPWLHMKRWWAITHPAQPVFRGFAIIWGDSFTLERPA